MVFERRLFTSALQSLVEQDWNGAAFENLYRYTGIYDAQGNSIDDLYEMWQTNTWVTDDETKNIYAYDVNNNMEQDIVQKWVPSLLSVRNYRKYDYSNYNLYSAINESSSANDNILVYPNPTSGKIQVIGNQHSVIILEIFNTLGEKVYAEKILTPIAIGVQSSILNLDLPNGIYLVQLKTSEGIVSKKLIVGK